MILLTIPHFSFNTDIGFLRIKQWVVDNDVWLTSFYVHVLTSIVLLLSGFTQFSSYIIKNYPRLHKLMGKSYMMVLLFLSAPSGFIMAIYANGGPVAQTAFLSLTVLWFFMTIQAWRMIKKKNYEAHARFMFRSYALTLSALTLRIWKPSLAVNFDFQPMDLYRLVAWLGWVPNLIIAELLIYKKVHIRILSKLSNTKTRIF